jgi:hypothetical protein
MLETRAAQAGRTESDQSAPNCLDIDRIDIDVPGSQSPGPKATPVRSTTGTIDR